jgi:SAM-dependent methyltransferase
VRNIGPQTLLRPGSSPRLSMSASEQSSAYDSFAWVYNCWMAEDFCRRILPVVDRLVLSRIPRGARVLDLCCGSGQMARALSGRGFAVTGVDASEPMLQFARLNAPGSELIRADARAFSFPRRFAAAISIFNSLAHLETVHELEMVFRNVRAALLPRAFFLFDLSMEEAYTSKWRGSFGLVGDDRACIVRPAYDPARRMGRNEITLFRASGPAPASSASDESLRAARRNWERSDFYIEQRCHSEAEVRTALAAAEFNGVMTYDAQRELNVPGEEGRSFFLCVGS